MSRKTFLGRTAALLLAMGMMAGCGDKEAPVGPTPEATPTPVIKEELTPMPENTGTPEPTATPEPAGENNGAREIVIPDVTMEWKEIPDTEAFAFVRDMKIGWNLGNTFDASDANVTDELKYESAWCGAKTSQKLIKEIKEAGFQTIRIPVSWHNHVTGENYEISEAWMARVQEVADWALAEDMYVIINIHHDNSKEFFYPTSEYYDQSVKYITAIWKQIAERFQDYDNHLIFETLNEPRMVGTNYEWWINAGDASCKDAIQCINAYNQAAVDTIRATAGNNAERYIMVPGYDASADGALNAGFVLPADSAKDKLIVSVHAYTPYKFALENPGSKTFDADKKSDVSGITGFMNQLYNAFVSKGIPVVIGEFGARAKGNTQDRVDFSTVYIAAARERGITCCWWDNNCFLGNGEKFGLIDRLPVKWRFGEIVAALMKYAE